VLDSEAADSLDIVDTHDTDCQTLRHNLVVERGVLNDDIWSVRTRLQYVVVRMSDEQHLAVQGLIQVGCRG